MYAVLGLGGVGVLVALGLTGLAATKRRVPLTAWLLLPLLAMAFGAIGSLLSSGSLLSDAGAGAPEQLSELARLNYAKALLPDWLGRWMGAVGMAVSVWGAGLGATIGGDEDSVPTWFSAAFTALAGVIFTGLAAGYTVYAGLGTEAFALVGLLGFGSAGATLGALRRHPHDHAFRVAGMRFAAGLSLVFATSWAARAVSLGQTISLSKELATASSAKYADVLATGLATSDALWNLGTIAVFGALFVALANFFAELSEVVQKGTIVDMVGVVALLCFAFVTRAIERTGTESLRELGDLVPMATAVATLGYDIPAAAGMIGDKLADARPVSGGFGDVVQLTERKAENDDVIYEWKRTWIWNGTGWDANELPLAEAQLTPGRPVLVIAKSGAPAAKLEEGLKAIGGQGLLLLRTNEIHTEGVTPEVASRQGTMMPIRFADSVDFAGSFWIDGDTSTIFDGPVPRYGQGDDAKKLYDRILAAFNGSERKIVHVVAGERARVGDIVSQCLPAVVSEVDGELRGNDRSCVISAGNRADTIAAALEGWEAPKADNLKIAVTFSKDLDAAAYAPLIERDAAALGYCAARLLEEQPSDKAGEPPLPAELDKPVVGRLMYEGSIGYKGKMEGLYILDKSNIENESLRRCITRRLSAIDWPLMEKPVVEAGKEPPPLPKFELTLNYK